MLDMQREALAVLAAVWALSPDVRLGQLPTLVTPNLRHFRQVYGLQAENWID